MKRYDGVLRTCTVFIERTPSVRLISATANVELDLFWSTVPYAARVVKAEFFWLVFSHWIVLHAMLTRRESKERSLAHLLDEPLHRFYPIFSIVVTPKSGRHLSASATSRMSN